MDPIEQNHFRTAPDGSRVFFPWRPTGRGYRVPSPEVERRLTRVLGLLYVAMLVLGTIGYAWAMHGGTDPTLANVLKVVAAALLLAVLPLPFYVLWLSRVLPELAPSDFRVDSAAIRAEAISRLGPTDARNAALASLAFAAAAVLMACVDPAHRGFAIFAALFFVALGVFALRMQLARNRSSTTE